MQNKNVWCDSHNELYICLLVAKQVDVSTLQAANIKFTEIIFCMVSL
jgi:hypothetical protein